MSDVFEISGQSIAVDLVDDRCGCRCSSDEHDPEYCCSCGHFHSSWDGCRVIGESCGDYRCCH